MEKIVEVCCGSYYDVKNAYLGGANRIELNSSLFLGGLTPSLGSLKLTKKHFDIKTICMARPRGAGFLYNIEDFETMLEDSKIFLENGADGIAFGFLDIYKNIDIEKTKYIVDLIKKYKKEAVFHRAFDCVEDAYKNIESLINIGVDRVLTSGLKNKAIDGIGLIKELNFKYGDKIEILAGSRINHTNAKEILEKTGINQIHSSCKKFEIDKTTSGKEVSYAYIKEENKYDIVSKELVEMLVKSIKK